MKRKINNPFKTWKPARFNAGKKVVIRQAGKRFVNLTRWLPTKVQTSKGPVVLEDDFSIITARLRQDGIGFVIKENASNQRALFVEMR